MAANIEERIVEKMRNLPLEKQQEILEFVERLATDTEPQKRTIWEKIREHAREVPDEVWEQVPADGAEQHDHYLYGAPKK